MKNNSAILHISDLHILDFTPINGKQQYTYVDESDDFLNDFVDSVKTECAEIKSKLEYIFITGDIANAGKKQEYEKAEDFLNKLIKKLEVKKENVRIAPGNHDINWTDIDSYVEDENFKDKPYKLHDIKFKKFKKFYDSFFSEVKLELDCKSPVVDFLIDKENELLILTLNSIFYESSTSEYHHGCIDHKTLREFLEGTFKNGEYKTFGRIALLHHHSSTFINNETYSWVKVEQILNKYDFNVFIHGHVHDDNSESKDDGELNYYVGVGSLAKKDDKIVNSYNIFYNGEEQFKFDILTVHHSEKSTKKVYWQPQTRIKAKRHFITKSEPLNVENDYTDVDKVDAFEDYSPKETSKEYSLSSYAFEPSEKLKINKKKVINHIRVNKLFKTGHFHWTESFRSHGLIDIFGLITNSEMQALIISSFREVINTRNIKIENMFGVGFEGNILGSLLSMQYPNSAYSYITNSNEYFNEFEKKIVSDKKNITIIEDVIFQADSLNKLMNDNSEVINKIEQVDLITLFFCGRDEDLREIEKIPKLKFHYIFDEIRIESCPYSAMKLCPIVTNNLDKYYNFY